MKKIGLTVLMVIAFMLIYFLQAHFFTNITIAGIKPNLIVIFILFIGLYSNAIYGTVSGILVGLFLDCIYGKCIGVSAVMLCAIGFLGAYFDKNFSKESRLTIMLMAIGATAIFEAGYYLLSAIILNFDMQVIEFIKMLLLELLYNTLLTLILYPIIQKLGYILEENFKKTNILTRYF